MKKEEAFALVSFMTVRGVREEGKMRRGGKKKGIEFKDLIAVEKKI